MLSESKGILTVFQGDCSIKIGEEYEFGVGPHGLELFWIGCHLVGCDIKERFAKMI